MSGQQSLERERSILVSIQERHMEADTAANSSMDNADRSGVAGVTPRVLGPIS
jgi:hypothetical protein